MPKSTIFDLIRPQNLTPADFRVTALHALHHAILFLDLSMTPPPVLFLGGAMMPPQFLILGGAKTTLLPSQLHCSRVLCSTSSSRVCSCSTSSSRICTRPWSTVQLASVCAFEPLLSSTFVLMLMLLLQLQFQGTLTLQFWFQRGRHCHLLFYSRVGQVFCFWRLTLSMPAASGLTVQCQREFQSQCLLTLQLQFQVCSCSSSSS